MGREIGEDAGEEDVYNGDYGGDHSDLDVMPEGGGKGGGGGACDDDERHVAAPIRPFKLKPTSGAALYELEIRRRRRRGQQEQQQQRRGMEDGKEGGKERSSGGGGGGVPPAPLRIGCTELDEYVLVGGGFERGAVFGISSEDVEVGMAVSESLFLSLCLFFLGNPASFCGLPQITALSSERMWKRGRRCGFGNMVTSS